MQAEDARREARFARGPDGARQGVPPPCRGGVRYPAPVGIRRIGTNVHITRHPRDHLLGLAVLRRPPRCQRGHEDTFPDGDFHGPPARSASVRDSRGRSGSRTRGGQDCFACLGIRVLTGHERDRGAPPRCRLCRSRGDRLLPSLSASGRRYPPAHVADRQRYGIR